MDKCEVKKGLFVLSSCNNTTTIRCDECLIAVCEKHMMQDGPRVKCADCYAKAHPEKFKNMGKGSAYDQYENNYYSNYGLWYFGMRHNFYQSNNYHPFDQNDYSSFNQQNNMDFSDDQESGSFFDS